LFFRLPFFLFFCTLHNQTLPRARTLAYTGFPQIWDKQQPCGITPIEVTGVLPQVLYVFLSVEMIT